MAAEERRSEVLELVRLRGFVSVADLVTRFHVSTMTIRRDLAVLAARGAIEKVHGGGVLPRPLAGDRDQAGWSAPVREQPRRERRPTATYVGIVVPNAHYYFPIVVDGVRRVLDAREIRRALAISGYDREHEQVLVRQLLDAGSTGLLLAPSVALDDPAEAAWLFELPVPVVLVERTAHASDGSSLSSVRTDHALGCRRAIRHLAHLGHRGVALVTQGVSQTKSRVVDGWRLAVAEAGLDAARSPLVVTSQQVNRGSANDALDSVLAELRADRVTATLVHSDQTALSLVHHARHRGVRVPEDLSVIAYDNAIAEMADPPLTAVSPPKDWMGQAAAELLLDLLAAGPAKPVRHIVAEPDLVVRSSTAAPRQAELPG